MINRRIPVTSKQACAADVSAPVLRKGKSTTRGLELSPVRDSLKLASSTSSSTSRLRLETNVGGAAYVVEEITRRHDHSHTGFEARGHHLSEDLTCSGIVNPTSTVPGSQKSRERGVVDFLKRVGARQSSK